MAIYSIKLSNIWYEWRLLMASLFLFVFPFLWYIFTTHQTVRGQQECDFFILEFLAEIQFRVLNIRANSFGGS